MENKSTIRDEIGKIIGIRIPPGKYHEVFLDLARAGKLDPKTVNLSLIAIFEAIEELQSERK